MKTALLISALSLMSFSTFAACDVSLTEYDGSPARSFKADLSQILTNKGYNVVEAVEGEAQEAGRALVKVSAIAYISKDGCSSFTDGRVECAATISVQTANENGNLNEATYSHLDLYTKSSLFKSRAKIMKGFKEQFLAQAEATIPECK